MEKVMEKTYAPEKVEEKLYSTWMDKGYFRAEIDYTKKPFTIVIPPPNITGQLHMGHALDNTLQDILARWKRMSGYATLWLPGTDHASIATEVKIVEELAKEGKTKNDLGREEFLKRAWQWKEQYGGRIVDQLKRLGSSCDWSRERFTMDEGCSRAVTEVFVRLYEKGLIYRGDRIINWCIACKTALSDAEVEYSEKQGNLWHIKYPVKDSGEFIIIATTRPETMLGDTAVAVHPEDERYKHLVGRTVILPLLNREIPVVADEYVDKEFGTGAVKITPAHDPNDFEVMLRHDLDSVRIMDDGGVMNFNAGPYQGLDRHEARKKVVDDLKKQGLLIKVEDHIHNVGECYRCGTIVEPIISKQWFVKMEPLARKAIDVVRQGEIKFIPERFSKIYFNWMENIKDWCISRQLWWGHRIPAYYCQECGHTMVCRERPSTCSKCSHSNIIQDPDVLDTWFSSALWPFSTLGWPDDTEDLRYFYPTDVLVTGYDIIFFWVARMIFSGLEQMKEKPFSYVLVHGIVRDAQGRKMSKSLGNGIDPLEVIDKYGADALRYSLIIGNSPGNDMRFYWEKAEAGRNFANKIWNAARFVHMHIGDRSINKNLEEVTDIADQWILSRYNRIVKEVTNNLEKFELGIAFQKLYDFIWDEYCDWYIELVKPRLFSQDEDSKSTALFVLSYVLSNTLKLLHPFMPFITEEIWQHLPNEGGSIMISSWPEYNDILDKPQTEKQMEIIMDAIKGIRNIRSEMNVPASKRPKAVLVRDDQEFKLTEEYRAYFCRLAGDSQLEVQDDRQGIPDNAVSLVTGMGDIYIPLEDLVDIDMEIERLKKEKERLEAELKRVNGKLANKAFIEKAPERIVQEERDKKVKYQQMYDRVMERLKALQ